MVEVVTTFLLTIYMYRPSDKDGCEILFWWQVYFTTPFPW